MPRESDEKGQENKEEIVRVNSCKANCTSANQLPPLVRNIFNKVWPHRKLSPPHRLIHRCLQQKQPQSTGLGEFAAPRWAGCSSAPNCCGLENEADGLTCKYRRSASSGRSVLAEGSVNRIRTNLYED